MGVTVPVVIDAASQHSIALCSATGNCAYELMHSTPPSPVVLAVKLTLLVKLVFGGGQRDPHALASPPLHLDIPSSSDGENGESATADYSCGQ